jgi:hypothetical protein
MEDKKDLDLCDLMCGSDSEELDEPDENSDDILGKCPFCGYTIKAEDLEYSMCPGCLDPIDISDLEDV